MFTLLLVMLCFQTKIINLMTWNFTSSIGFDRTVYCHFSSNSKFLIWLLFLAVFICAYHWQVLCWLFTRYWRTAGCTFVTWPARCLTRASSADRLNSKWSVSKLVLETYWDITVDAINITCILRQRQYRSSIWQNSPLVKKLL